MDYSICYKSKELGLVGYLGANWTGDLNECKSASTYHFWSIIMSSHEEARNKLIHLCQSWKPNLSHVVVQKAIVKKIFAKVRNAHNCFFIQRKSIVTIKLQSLM